MTRKGEKEAAAAAAMDCQDGAGSPLPQRAARSTDKTQEPSGKAAKSGKQWGKEQPRDMVYYAQKMQGQSGAPPP